MHAEHDVFARLLTAVTKPIANIVKPPNACMQRLAAQLSSSRCIMLGAQVSLSSLAAC